MDNHIQSVSYLYTQQHRMNTQEGKVILVTGISTGIGRLTVECVARLGHSV